jgi:hypothetical protein
MQLSDSNPRKLDYYVFLNYIRAPQKQPCRMNRRLRRPVRVRLYFRLTRTIRFASFRQDEQAAQYTPTDSPTRGQNMVKIEMTERLSKSAARLWHVLPSKGSGARGVISHT